MENMTHTFRRQRVEICLACQGGGFAEAANDSSVMPVCPLCQGSGRVVKTWEGTVKIEAYMPDSTANCNPWDGCWP